MKKNIFELHKGKYCKVVLNPNFVVYGYIDDVFEDCFILRSNTRTTYVDFNNVVQVGEAPEGDKQ